MKAIKIIGVIIILLLAALIISIYSLPSTAHMERSIVIKASPSEVYRELISFRNFNAWSPWAQKDTATSYSYEGPEMGVGARINWSSDDQDVGEGYMKIIEAEKNKRVKNVMHFDGYTGEPTATFLLEPVDEGTSLTWTYDEENVSGMNKLFMLGIDGFLGEDYENGLARIKNRVESAPHYEYDITLKKVQPFTYIGIKDSSLNDPSIISTKMAQNYGELMSYLGNRGLEIAGHPVAIYPAYDDQELTFICGLPIDGQVEVADNNLIIDQTPGGLALMVRHVGGYTDLQKTYDELGEFARWHKYQLAGNPWEEYITDPETEPDTSQWITHIYLPVK